MNVGDLRQACKTERSFQKKVTEMLRMTQKAKATVNIPEKTWSETHKSESLLEVTPRG